MASIIWVPAGRIFEIFGLHEKTVRIAANEGKVVRRYVGTKPLYRADSISEWIESQPDEKP